MTYLAVGKQAKQSGPLPYTTARDCSYNGGLLLCQLTDGLLHRAHGPVHGDRVGRGQILKGDVARRTEARLKSFNHNPGVLPFVYGIGALRHSIQALGHDGQHLFFHLHSLQYEVLNAFDSFFIQVLKVLEYGRLQLRVIFPLQNGYRGNFHQCILAHGITYLEIV